MNESTFFHWLLAAWFVLAVGTFVLLFFVTAPYGRHTRKGWGPRMNRRLGWVVMEIPAGAVFALCFFLGGAPTAAVYLVFFALWAIHYIHRTLVFPFRIRGGSKNITLTAVLLGVMFNSANGYLNGRYLFGLGPAYTEGWLTDPRFILGVVLFFAGMAINQHSDHLLIRLRKPGDNDYRIPHGGLFRYVSSPNYFGELVEWIGWAVATWSPAGLAFAAWTAANLIPRAWANHKWYRKKFPDYPPERKAMVPFVF